MANNMDQRFEAFEAYMAAKYGLVPKKVDGAAVEETSPSSKKKAAERTPLEQAQHNVELWEKKLEENKFKDEDAKEKHIAKLEKEKAKLIKLEAGEEPTKRSPPKKKNDEEAKEKRVVKMTPTYVKHLKDAIVSNGVDIEYTKELGHELVEFINNLSDEVFKSKGLKDHINDFVKSKPAVPKPASNVVGGGPDTTLDTVVILELSELQKIELTASVPGKPSVFWDTKNSRYVTGPTFDEDEDSTEVTFEDKEYAVGDVSGRVYEVRESGDVFAGFVGVGKFKNMKV